MQAAAGWTIGVDHSRREGRIRSIAKNGLIALLFVAGLLHGCATNTVSVPVPTPRPGPALTLIESPEVVRLSITTTEHPEARGSVESTVLFGGKMRGFGAPHAA